MLCDAPRSTLHARKAEVGRLEAFVELLSAMRGEVESAEEALAKKGGPKKAHKSNQN